MDTVKRYLWGKAPAWFAGIRNGFYQAVLLLVISTASKLLNSPEVIARAGEYGAAGVWVLRAAEGILLQLKQKFGSTPAV